MSPAIMCFDLIDGCLKVIQKNAKTEFIVVSVVVIPYRLKWFVKQFIVIISNSGYS